MESASAIDFWLRIPVVFGLGHGMRFIVSLPLRFQGQPGPPGKMSPKGEPGECVGSRTLLSLLCPWAREGKGSAWLLLSHWLWLCPHRGMEGWEEWERLFPIEKGLGTLSSGGLQASPWGYSDLTANIRSFCGAGDPANLLQCQEGEAAFPGARNLEPGGIGVLVDHYMWPSLP